MSETMTEQQKYEEAYKRYMGREKNPNLILTFDFFGRPAYALRPSQQPTEVGK